MRFYQFLVTAMLDSQKSGGGRSADEILRDVADVLDFRDCKAFLKVSVNFLKVSVNFLKVRVNFLKVSVLKFL